MALVAVGWFVRIRAERIAEVKAERIGPEGWVDDGDVFFGDGFWIVAVSLVETFFEGVIHGIDSGLAVLVAFECVDVVFLDEEKN